MNLKHLFTMTCLTQNLKTRAEQNQDGHRQIFYSAKHHKCAIHQPIFTTFLQVLRPKSLKLNVAQLNKVSTSTIFSSPRKAL